MECSLSEGASRYLDTLYEEYERFDVQQTTVGVSCEEFDAIAERPDGIAVRARIRGEDGFLMRPDGNDWTLPGGILDADPDRETVAERLERWTGLRCRIEGLDRVSLVGLQCEAATEELWTISAVFSTTATGGSPRGHAAWRNRKTPITVPSL
ncbi:hypothetical protein [Natronomonas sp. LN261]|jgi:ADP-ribose pyrophosphatase YjhB (NUDIX family)|uniref:hypothetical protein n=1 Tax=Natronomonas sp. LN261 TaxID=2750669 RepID=UPI0015EE84EE|nr:hypothetical protein [Natronomonas sp. LN261]